MDKGESLIRDIGRLFVKYSIDDWAMVIELLRTGGPEHVRIAQAIAEISAKRPTSHKQAKQPRPERAPTFEPDVDPDRVELLGKVYGDLSRTTGPKLAELRDIYIRSGGKQKLPQKRDEIARAL